MSEGVIEQAVGEIIFLTMDTSMTAFLNASTRAELLGKIEDVMASGTARAIVLAAKGRGYPASVPDEGGDAAEERRSPDAASLMARIENSSVPIFAAMHGRVTGLGLELGLAAHYRIADQRTRFGFPGLAMGLLPEAGGIQRLSRVVGPIKALEILLSGRLSTAVEALDAGLVDCIADVPLPRFTLQYVREILARGGSPRPAGMLESRLSARRVLLNELASRREALGLSFDSPEGRAFECVEASLLLPYEAALGIERAAAEDLRASDKSRALRHLYRAEIAAAKPPVAANAAPRRIAELGVVGAGWIGRGVVSNALAAGLPVTLVERSIETLEHAVEQIIDEYDREIARGRLGKEARESRLARLTGSVDLASLATADVVIESIREDADEKRRLFGALDTVMKRDALLATTTASLDIDGLAAGTTRSDQTLGLTFFPPVSLSSVVEVVIAMETSDGAIATAWELARLLGKTAVPATVAEGFVIRRVLGAARAAAELTLLEGATVSEIDTTMRDYGMLFGPFEAWDLDGLDRPWAGPMEATDLPARLRDAGRTGRRAGRGWYSYSAGVRRGYADEEVDVIVDVARAASGIDTSQISSDAIQRRILAAMANAGARLVAEGVALRPADIDLGVVLASRFPRASGGPMMSADLAGLLRIKRDLDEFSQNAVGGRFWAPEPLLSALVKNGLTFDDLNRDPDRVQELL